MAIAMVANNTLVRPGAVGQTNIAVGSEEWRAWLSEAKRFLFVGSHGTFTAYKERTKRGEPYWRACLHRSGKLSRIYLGKGDCLSPDRLDEAACLLSALEPAGPVAQSGIAAGSRRSGGEPLSEQGAFAPSTAALNNEQQRNLALRAKLSPPPVRPVDVARPRLIERLNEALRHKLTVVLAPAGYGKTTLLGQWARAGEHRVAWLTLDSGDRALVRFWMHFVFAIESQYQAIGDGFRQQLRSGMWPDESFLVSLANALIPVDDLVLVLDDYHVVQHPAIDEGIAFMLAHLPATVHLVISSRSEPGLPLVRMRASSELLEVKAANLCFTRDEADAFLNDGMQLGLTKDETLMLRESIEGWAMGLQLAGLWMQDSDDVHRLVAAFGGAHREVVDYLVGEVLDQQSGAVREFLLQTSILESLNGHLCDAVCHLAPGEGQEMLEYLDRANLFTIASDAERHWYRYHHLFADCLRDCLSKRQPELVPQLHRRASEWCATNGLTTPAVKHALAANDAELAASLIERNGARLIKRGDVGILLYLLANLPEETARSRPWLCLFEAMALVISGRKDAAETRLRDVERHASGVATSGAAWRARQGDVDRAGIRAAALCLRANVAAMEGNLRKSAALWKAANQEGFQDTEAAAVIAAQARMGLVHYFWLHGDGTRATQLLSEAERFSRADGSAFENVLILWTVARVQMEKGQLRDAERTLRQALRIAFADAAGMMAAGSVFASLALLSYEWNRISAARAYAAKAEAVADKRPRPNPLLLAYRVLCLSKMADEDAEGAFDFLERAEELGYSRVSPAELAWVFEYRVRLWLAQGNVRTARRQIETRGIETDGRLADHTEAEQRALARVLIAEDRPADALLVLNRLASSAESAGRFWQLIETLVLCAIAERDLGQTDQALGTLDRALLLAEPEGYVRTFVDGGPPVAALLTQMLKAKRCRCRSRLRGGAAGEYIAKLLSAFAGEDRESGDTKPCEPNGTAASSTLSEREREVLRLIADGWSRQGIARELIVSRHTIDAHLRNAYEKLNAHNRVEATARAKQLHLL